MNPGEELATAVAIATEAGEVLTSYFRSDRMHPRSKGERDVVTMADTECERLVLDRLRRSFPSDGVVGEEGANAPGDGERRWYIDPLDGTLNYSHGLPFWCVSLSLYEGGQPALGVIYDPLRNDTFTALRGEGVWLNEAPLETTGLTDMAAAMVHLTIDFNEASLRAGLEDVQRLAPHVLRTRNTGSAALALAYLAAGYLDGMVHRYAHPWDYGAGVLMVREAGGTVMDITGADYGLDSYAIVAGASAELEQSLRSAISSPAPVVG